MLFNSFPFLLGFLPAALLAHWLVERFRPAWRLPLLCVLSFLFYGYWDWRFVPLLAGSILVNWFVAETFQATGRRLLIPLAIAANLLVLALFKYFNFSRKSRAWFRESPRRGSTSRCRSASRSSPSTTSCTSRT